MPRMKRTLKRTNSSTSADDTSKKIKQGSRSPAKELNSISHKDTNGTTKSDVLLNNFYDEPGVILSVGSGDVGQLGLGEDVVEKLRPALIPNLEDVVFICAGGMHNVCLKKNGTVLTWGCNDEGALGRQGTESIPKEIELPIPAVLVSAGDSHSAALLQDGRVFAWGSFRDASGNMGLIQTGQIERKPIEILSNTHAVKIASGADHLVVLTKKGQVYTLGCGQQGQLGRLSTRATDRESRQGIGSSLHPDTVVLKRKTEIVDIWAGTYCTFLKDSNNDIHVFGLNNYHQIGLKNTEPYFRPTKSNTFIGNNWKKICSGLHHTLALSSDGKVYVMGRKEYGRLGLGENCNDATTLVPVPALENKKCVDIACGSSTSFAVTDTGELYSWGMGTGGALGTGEDDVYEPTIVQGKQLADRVVLQVASGGQHTIILTKSKK